MYLYGLYDVLFDLTKYYITVIKCVYLLKFVKKKKTLKTL